MKFTKYILAVFALYAGFTACRKNRDNTPPQIQRLLPISNTSFLQYENQIVFSYQVSDNEALASYQAFLKDEQNRIVWSKGGSLSETSASINLAIIHDNPHWESGLYLLHLIVEDQQGNSSSAFYDIQVSGAPLQLLQTLLFTDDIGQSSSILSLQEDYSLESVATISHDLFSVEVSSWNQQIILGGDQLAYLTFFNPENHQIVHQYTGQNPLGGHFVTDIYEQPGSYDLFVSTFDQKISRYGATGGLEFTFQVDQSIGPIQIGAWEDFIVAIMDPVNNSDQLLNIYYTSSGALYLSLMLDIIAEELIIWDNRVVIFGNDDFNNPAIRIFDLETESIFDPGWIISSDPIKTALYLESGWFALGHENGVYIQNFNSNAFFDGSVNGLNAKSMDYDPTTGLVYVLSTNTLSTISLSGAVVVESIAVPQETVFIKLLFNK